MLLHYNIGTVLGNCGRLKGLADKAVVDKQNFSLYVHLSHACTYIEAWYVHKLLYVRTYVHTSLSGISHALPTSSSTNPTMSISSNGPILLYCPKQASLFFFQYTRHAMMMNTTGKVPATPLAAPTASRLNLG